MVEDPAPFSPVELEWLHKSTFVRAVECHDQLASTNDRAMEWAAAEDLPLPALIVARSQTAGRGRGGNHWWSREGSLTFSLVLEPQAWGTVGADWPKVSLTVGLAVCLALEPLARSCRPKLKWPNDVYLEDRKICGVLIEVPQRAAGRVVIGIGINVNNSFDAAPPPQRQTAVSLSQVTGQTHRLASILQAVLVHLDEQLSVLAACPSDLLERWAAYCMLRDRRIVWDRGVETHTGLCLGIDAQGALLLKTDDAIHAIHGGVVRPL